VAGAPCRRGAELRGGWPPSAAVEEARRDPVRRLPPDLQSSSAARFSACDGSRSTVCGGSVESAASVAWGQIDDLEGVWRHCCGGLFLSRCSAF
jgi:hypothetical protein